jgi:GT2 family glycosyltransferase
VKTPSITIVTPWLNGRELERDYFAAMRCIDAEHLVIDDHSDPPLPNALHPGERFGFSGCSNVGLEAARTDAVLFLNNDIAAQRPGWIEPIRDLLEPGVLVGAQLRTDPHGMVDGQPMPYLDGWCVAGMTDDLLGLDGWDETFDEPSYYGDNDLSFRARLAGITLKEARVPVVHLRDTKPPVMPSPHVQAVTVKNKARFEARVRAELGVAA